MNGSVPRHPWIAALICNTCPEGSMDFRKKDNIAATRQQVGWAYPEMRWFSEDEAREANRQRNALLDALSGSVAFDSQGSKPHIGALSPGCLICGEGTWGCNFISGLCEETCFYCPREQNDRGRRPTTDGCEFESPQDHVHYLRAVRLRGVGFSGGEPLLFLDRLIAHAQAIRKALGETIYLWVYTGGSLADRGTLQDLQRAGLDEIRFDIAARDYDLSPVALAREYFSTVTVEIPAIPEDLGTVEALLTEMQTMGVSYLNIHQLNTTQHNFRALNRRGYHFLHQAFVPVFESELAALSLLRFASEREVRLPINYCCASYKDRFQGRGLRRRLASAVLRKGHEDITDAGYIRSFRVSDTSDRIKVMLQRFMDANCTSDKWECERTGTSVAIHCDLLPYVEWTSAEVTLQYAYPGVRLNSLTGGFVEGNLVAANQVAYQQPNLSQAAAECWRKLFIAKTNAREAFGSFYLSYPATERDSIAKAQEEAACLKRLYAWEELETGLPEVY